MIEFVGPRPTRRGLASPWEASAPGAALSGVIRSRGSEVLPDAELARCGLATIHPPAILHADEAKREAELQALVDDLRAAAKLLSN